MPQANVAIREDFCHVPVPVEGDPAQLHQVFVNLLLNGIEAMPGGGELCVAVQDATLPDGCCQVTVRDSGSGIAENILERMFEPFVTSKERGTGLGLAISRRIVQQHGGKLMAANRQARGACSAWSCRDAPSFLFRPGDTRAMSSQTRRPFPVPLPALAERPTMRRLLIIDDEPSVRMGIEAVFEREDVAVFAAETANEGLHWPPNSRRM